MNGPSGVDKSYSGHPPVYPSLSSNLWKKTRFSTSIDLERPSACKSSPKKTTPDQEAIATDATTMPAEKKVGSLKKRVSFLRVDDANGQ
jgi:hypothetical protein